MATERKTIAIVDDDPGVRTALRELLRSMGFAAVAFASAEEFLSSSWRLQADCLIADVHLPGISGAALIKALAGAGVDLPALLITAHDDPATIALIRQVGSVPHLRKPFSDDALVDAIRRALAA